MLVDWVAGERAAVNGEVDYLEIRIPSYDGFGVRTCCGSGYGGDEAKGDLLAKKCAGYGVIKYESVDWLYYELGSDFGEAVVDGVIAWMGRVKLRHVR
jgi:hypothetical protein